MTYLNKLITEFALDDAGATAIEYGLIATLISVALIGGATAAGGAINDRFLCVRNVTRLTYKFNDGLGPCG